MLFNPKYSSFEAVKDFVFPRFNARMQSPCYFVYQDVFTNTLSNNIDSEKSIIKVRDHQWHWAQSILSMDNRDWTQWCKHYSLPLGYETLPLCEYNDCTHLQHLTPPHMCLYKELFREMLDGLLTQSIDSSVTYKILPYLCCTYLLWPIKEINSINILLYFIESLHWELYDRTTC